MNLINLSLVVPLYNEEDLVENNIILYYEYLSGLDCIEDFEIVAVDNACTDSTPLKLKKIHESYKKLKVCRTKKKGLGLALKTGLNESKYSLVMFTAIDICFGLDIIRLSVEKYGEGYDLVLGSKGHKKSIYKADFRRKAFSKFYNFLLRTLFNTKIHDTQGTFLLNKDFNKSVIDSINSEGAWFQTSLVLYSNAYHKNSTEVPVKYIAGKRGSKMKYRDALRALEELFKGYLKYKVWVKSGCGLEAHV